MERRPLGTRQARRRLSFLQLAGNRRSCVGHLVFGGEIGLARLLESKGCVGATI